MFKEEFNSWIHLVIIITVVVSGFLLDISGSEWVYISLSIGLVFSLEIINTAIEFLADFVSPEKHPAIKKVKDLAAGAVLFAAFAAFAVGIIVFLPKLMKLC
jgi:diacylglycerol kinase